MPRGPLAHIALLVKDLDQAIADWKVILSRLDPHQAEREPTIVERFGPESDPVRWATFVSDQGAEIQLVQPLGEDGPRARRIREEGEGVDHICFVHPDLEGVMGKLADDGVELIPDGIRSDRERLDWQAWTYITKEGGHGVPVEIAYPYKDEDGKWVPGVDPADQA